MRREPVALWLFRAAFGITLSVVTWLALASEPPLDSPVFSFDKLNHTAAFLVLGFLAHHSFPASGTGSRFAALVAYGLSLELLQALGGERQFEWFDLGADALGLVIYEFVSPWASRAVSRLSSSHTGQ